MQFSDNTDILSIFPTSPMPYESYAINIQKNNHLLTLHFHESGLSHW